VYRRALVHGTTGRQLVGRVAGAPSRQLEGHQLGGAGPPDDEGGVAVHVRYERRIAVMDVRHREATFLNTLPG